jgi:hypothetical protein
MGLKERITFAHATPIPYRYLQEPSSRVRSLRGNAPYPFSPEIAVIQTKPTGTGTGIPQHIVPKKTSQTGESVIG